MSDDEKLDDASCYAPASETACTSAVRPGISGLFSGGAESRFALYACLFGWMALIFLFSAHPHSSEATRHVFHDFNFLARKFSHFSEYVILAALAFFAFATHISPAETNYDSPAREKTLQAALSLGVLYAISDELHQAFVPGRSAAIHDILIDTLGVVAGAFLAKYLGRWFFKKR